MSKWMASRQGVGSDSRRLSLDLKRCPLCGTINALSISECVTCSWHGEFVRDPEVIEDGLYEMMVRCPELAEALIDRPTASRKPSLWERLIAFFGRRRLDYTA